MKICLPFIALLGLWAIAVLPLAAQTAETSDSILATAQEINATPFAEVQAAFGRDTRVATILEEAARQLSQQGRHADALPFAEKAMALRRGGSAPAVLDRAASLTLLADVQHALKADDRAEPLYLEAKAILEQAAETKSPAYAKILEGLSDVYRAAQQLEKAAALRALSRQIRGQGEGTTADAPTQAEVESKRSGNAANPAEVAEILNEHSRGIVLTDSHKNRPSAPHTTEPASGKSADTRNPQANTSVDDVLKKLRNAQIAFNTPNTVQLGRTAVIQLLMSLKETVEELKGKLEAAGGKAGASIQVSDRMEAKLTGPNFEITLVTPETQAISAKQETEWKWEISPKAPGEHSLHLTLNAFVTVEGVSTPRMIKTFDTIITVQAVAPTWQESAGQFVGNNWQWLWAALVVPAFGWIMHRKKSGSD